MNERTMKAVGVVVGALALTACATFWGRGDAVRVADAGGSLNCPESGPVAWILELPSLDAVRTWQSQHGVELLAPGAEPGRYAIVGMGQRPTGGYGVAVSRQAILYGTALRLKATFVAPESGAMTAQMLTSPCALVRLPRDVGWQAIEVYDQTGRLRASQPAAQ